MLLLITSANSKVLADWTLATMVSTNRELYMKYRVQLEILSSGI